MLTFAALCILVSQDNDCPNPNLNKNIKNTHKEKLF